MVIKGKVASCEATLTRLKPTPRWLTVDSENPEPYFFTFCISFLSPFTPLPVFAPKALFATRAPIMTIRINKIRVMGFIRKSFFLTHYAKPCAVRENLRIVKISRVQIGIIPFLGQWIPYSRAILSMDPSICR